MSYVLADSTIRGAASVRLAGRESALCQRVTTDDHPTSPGHAARRSAASMDSHATERSTHCVDILRRQVRVRLVEGPEDTATEVREVLGMSVKLPMPWFCWSPNRTLADEQRDHPRAVDTTPHEHFHGHGGTHVHTHSHPDDHAHSNRTDLPRHD